MITYSDLRELADQSLSGDAPSSMSEPFRNRLGMGPSRRGNSNASCSAGVAWSGSVAWVRSPSSWAAPRGAFSCLTLDSGYSSLHGTFRSSIPPVQTRRLFSLSSTALLSSRLFTHEDRRMYAQLRLPVRVGRSTLWQDQSPGQTNPPPRRIVLYPPDPYRAKELPGDP
ncbi:hypothetical protein KIW84_024154 [Lathyrus oleraceus]|uniref:Uncharacterized protein n=1 Tax=Pisum sativum TaxID=3888 RepID=A0A9D5B913_PEA|nr:hypothetical protein KIW84_024154 [Pisum sativum]